MKYGIINKQLRADRITLFVKLWFELTDEGHVKHWAVELVLIFPQEFEVPCNVLWLLQVPSRIPRTKHHPTIYGGVNYGD